MPLSLAPHVTRLPSDHVGMGPHGALRRRPGPSDARAARLPLLHRRHRRQQRRPAAHAVARAAAAAVFTRAPGAVPEVCPVWSATLVPVRYRALRVLVPVRSRLVVCCAPE
eukprot:scaffold6790_cov69-Phaeocystis_antarctica.AAC.3